MVLGCFPAEQEVLYHILPPFWPSVRPLHKVLVSSGERYGFLILGITLLVLREFGVTV